MRLPVTFTIPLPPVTKKNSQRVVPCGRYHKILPSKAYERYEHDAGAFLPYKWTMWDKPCEVVCLFYLPTRRRVDLTNLLEAIDDVLVHYGVLKDDNTGVIVSHDGSRALYDKDRPRTVVTIKSVEDKTMADTTIYRPVDGLHNTWQCGECGHLERFEADGPYENGWNLCPACGRELEREGEDDVE